MDRFDIEQVLIKYINDYSVQKGIDVAYPNTLYEPTINTKWLKVSFLQSKPSDTVLSTGYERINGIMQVDINIPKDTGAYDIYEIYKDLKEIFKTNGILRDGDNYVHLQSVYLEGQRVSESWFTKYLTIEYSEFNK